MKIIVCIKTTPAPETVRVENGQIVWDTNSLIINPWDEYALEGALAFVEWKQIAEPEMFSIVAISIGDASAEIALRHALAMGVQEAIRIAGPPPEELDTRATAHILAAAVRKIHAIEPVALVLFGRQSIDSDSGLTAAQTARLLGWPSISNLSTIKSALQKVRLARTMEEGRQILNTRFPIVCSVAKDIGTPRYPSFFAKRRAERTPIPVWTLDDLAITPPPPLVRWGEASLPPERETACEWINGTPEEIAARILDILESEGLL